MSKPLFGGWTPTYEGDPCRGGHPPQSVTAGTCGRCGRLIDESRCLCGEESHRGGLSRSMCPNRMRFDQRDAEDHAGLFNDEFDYNTFAFRTEDNRIAHTYSNECPPECYGQLEDCVYADPKVERHD